jgi:hypothetical protein
MERPIYGVYFVCCINHYQVVVREQLNIMTESGLLSKIKKLICFITSCDDEQVIKNILQEYDSECTIQTVVTKENTYEKLALNNFRKYITDNVYYMFYCHTKGVSHLPKNKYYPVFEFRRKNLNFCILQKHNMCLQLLNKGYDVVGVSLSQYPTLHFSGNFWWTRSEHLIKLPEQVRESYLGAEMYICSNKNGKYISICQDTNDKDITNLTDNELQKQKTLVSIKNTCHKNLKY